MEFLKILWVFANKDDKMNIFDITGYLSKDPLKDEDLIDNSHYSNYNLISLYIWNKFMRNYSTGTINDKYNTNIEKLKNAWNNEIRTKDYSNFNDFCIKKEKNDVYYKIQKILESKDFKKLKEDEISNITNKVILESNLNPESSMFRLSIDNPLDFIDNIVPTLYSKFEKLISDYNSLNIDDKIQVQNQIELYILNQIGVIMTLAINLSNFLSNANDL